MNDDSPHDLQISFVSGGVELLEQVGPLWTELRDFHARVPGPFSNEIAARTFDDRAVGWVKAEERGEEVLVDLAWAVESPVGYCVSTIDESGSSGVIDSLYVVEAHRGRGIGERLMRRALHWFDDNDVRERAVEVLVGNDRALGFYARFGFAPRTVVMRQARDRTQGLSPGL